MTSLGRGWWELLENRSQTAFVTAGILSLITSVLFALEAFTAVSRPVWLTGIIGSFGLIVAFVGLVGLYPGLRDREPRLARAGIALVALAGIGLLVFPLCLLAQTSGISLPAPPLVALVVAMIAIMLVFVLFGAASLRSGVHSRAVGFLLLMMVATFVGALIADLAYGGSPPLVNATVNGLQSGVLLTIGYILPVDPAQDQNVRLSTISG